MRERREAAARPEATISESDQDLRCACVHRDAALLYCRTDKGMKIARMMPTQMSV